MVESRAKLGAQSGHDSKTCSPQAWTATAGESAINWMQERDGERKDFLIGHSEAPHLSADLAERHAKLPQQAGLIVREVLVEKVHCVTTPCSRTPRVRRTSLP